MVPIAYSSEVLDLMTIYGERVRVARMRRRWSQAELSERMNVERRTVSRLEKGNPGVGMGVFLTALWILDLWETARNVRTPYLGSFL
jgi:transcriptional regulator with XRE-family HTH domain